MSTPATLNKTVFLAQDDVWSFRKTVNDEPIIPTEASAQIRNTFGGTLWLDCETNISNDGWIDIIISADKVTLDEWAGRFNGVWDLYVTVNNISERWIMGTVKVDRNVTI